MRWFWLSFADPDLPEGEQFLGALVISVEDADVMMAKVLIALQFPDHQDRVGRVNHFVAATVRATTLGVNPGGEVVGWDITDDIDKIPEDMRMRLLSKEETEALDQV